MGCGIGKSCKIMTERGYQATGIDENASFINNARLSCHTADFIQGHFSHLPFGNSSFDAVLCECVLSIASDLESQLAEIWRILNEKGMLLWSDLCLKESLDSSHLLTGDQWISEMSRSGFYVEKFEFAHEEWKNFVAGLLWNSADKENEISEDRRFSACMDAPARMISYCYGICRKKEA